MGIGSFVPGELEAGPVNQIRFLVFAWEMVNTHLFFLRLPSRENFRRWSLQWCRARSSKRGPDLPARYDPMIATLHSVTPVSGAFGDLVSNSR